MNNGPTQDNKTHGLSKRGGTNTKLSLMYAGAPHKRGGYGGGSQSRSGSRSRRVIRCQLAALAAVTCTSRRAARRGSARTASRARRQRRGSRRGPPERAPVGAGHDVLSEREAGTWRHGQERPAAVGPTFNVLADPLPPVVQEGQSLVGRPELGLELEVVQATRREGGGGR